MTIRVKVALEKQAHPERFCPFHHCLWRTSKLNRITGQREGGGHCPRHRPAPKFSATEMVATGFTFPGGQP